MAQLTRGASGTIKSFSTGAIVGVVGAVGAATSALTVEATTNLKTTDNLFSSCTRTSTGLFVITLKQLTNILYIVPEIYNASGTTLYATIRTWSLSAKTITLDVRDGASSSAVADPTTSDHIRVAIVMKDSNT